LRYLLPLRSVREHARATDLVERNRHIDAFAFFWSFVVGTTPYYAIISGFLMWCVEDERIPTNPALARRAKSELPEDTGERTTQQFWSDEDRTRLLRFVDQRAHDAIDEDGSEATTEVRDRALVRVLAFSGCRTAELVRDTRDDRRNGLFWTDVDLDGGTL